MERAHKKTNSQAPITCLQFMAEDRTECSASGQVRYTQRLEEYLPLAVHEEAATNLAEVAEYRAKKAEVEAKGERIPGEELVRAKIPLRKLRLRLKEKEYQERS